MSNKLQIAYLSAFTSGADTVPQMLANTRIVWDYQGWRAGCSVVTSLVAVRDAFLRTSALYRVT